MNIVTHATAGLAIAHFFPPEYMPIAVGFSLLPDLDHLINIKKWKFKINGFESAQTFMHGILGATIYGLGGMLIFLLNRELASLFLITVSIHLFLDFVGGVSTPFKHIEENPIVKNFGNPPDRIFGGRFWIRVLQEAVVISIGLFIFIHG
jgi:hypothetical protein